MIDVNNIDKNKMNIMLNVLMFVGLSIVIA